jgi:hypothetical protein
MVMAPVSEALARALIIYPLQGQSAQRQEDDRAADFVAAQSGYTATGLPILVRPGTIGGFITGPIATPPMNVQTPELFGEIEQRCKADPIATMEIARGEDPETLMLEAVMSEWLGAAGFNNPLRLASSINLDLGWLPSRVDLYGLAALDQGHDLSLAMDYRDLHFEVRNDDVLVTMPGSFRVVYRNPQHGSELVARFDYFRNRRMGPNHTDKVSGSRKEAR